MLRAGGKRLMVLGLGRHVTAFPSGEACGFHERVMDHYNNTRNVGSFDKNDPTVGTGLVGSPACGDILKLQIKVDENTDKIVDTCFKTFGCGHAGGFSPSFEWLKGKQMEEVSDIKNTEIPKHLCLPPVKFHCNMLAEDAIKAAVKDYKAKRGKLGSKNGVSTTENTEKDTAFEWLKGKQMEEVSVIKNTEIPKLLYLPPVKLHCNMLSEDAVKAAFKDYIAKRGKLGSKNDVSTTENTEKDAGDDHL